MSIGNVLEHWQIVELGEICEILDSQRIPINAGERNKRINGKSESELFPYYGATGVVGKIDGYLFDGEFVLVGEDAAPFLEPQKGVAYLVSGKFWVNNHVHILKHPTSDRFLCYYLCQINYRPFVTGTTRLKLNQARLRNIPLPLPPLNEQKRIVAKIEELFSELDDGEASLRRARQQLGVYRQSLLKQAFEGKLTAPWRTQNPHLLESADQLLARIQFEREARYDDQLKDWEIDVSKWKSSSDGDKRPPKPRKPITPTRIEDKELSKLASLPLGWNWMNLESLSSPEPRSIQSGPFGSSLKHSEFTTEGILVIGIDNVRDGYFSKGSQNRISPAKYEKLQKYTARSKDFLITIMATVGRCCRVPDELETAIITKHVYRISPNIGLIDSDYLVNAALGCPAIVKQIDQDKFGQTRPGLNGSFIKALPVPLCSLPEQKEIVRLLDQQFTVIEQNEREIDAALKRSEALRQSILKKAFSGQLVPQDPNDEPASILLDRIRTQREAAALAGTAKKKSIKKKVPRKKDPTA